MAPSSKTYPLWFKLKKLAMIFIFCVLFVLEVDAERVPFSRKSEGLQQKKMVLGSRPPGCVHKCLSCRPCMATLVVPSHQKKLKALSHHGGGGGGGGGEDDDGDGYYLLSWKCRCGDKLFQP
ncbi:EPIDERMAL PATTERNING FACTOR-like protein 2 [Mercurialis annua]|uniref:EPIDERMAL PATTERNING FACTOR-like protein 2 n=1 Tax=Mercurialis annua TaxID=3986 RepID=UPI002160D08D|nr:EPIDERMAL PATTERNING FACTOR-like protein 2 [Mercurialis annua]